MSLFATGSTLGPQPAAAFEYHDDHAEADHTVTVVDHTADHSDMDAVSGDFTVAGNLLVGGDVDGDAVIVSTIDVGDITADSFDCRVNATVQGDLLVSGTGDFAGDVSLFTNSDMYINGPHANYYGGGCILDNTFMIGGPGPADGGDNQSETVTVAQISQDGECTLRGTGAGLVVQNAAGVSNASINSLGDAVVQSLDCKGNGYVRGDLELFGTTWFGNNANINAVGKADVMSLDCTERAFTFGTDSLPTFVSNKFLPIDVASPAANEEAAVTSNDQETIVTRSRAGGVNVDNLLVRGRSADYSGPFPGLMFVEGTCTEQLQFKEDARLVFNREVGLGFTNQDNVIEFFAQPTDSTPHWVLNANGHLVYAHEDDPTHADAGAGTAVTHTDVVASDASVYIGSTRLSYDRTNHELLFQRLKEDQMPKWFTDRSYTVSNLPSGYATTETMSVQRWISLARSLASDPDLHVRDVFPIANSTDWQLMGGGGLGTSDQILGDDSLYIGSARYSYQRNNQEVRLKRLIPGHVPKFLGDQGYDSSDLPANHTIDEMSVIRWVKSARKYTGNGNLTVRDVFPSSAAYQSADWEFCDAPIPAAEARITTNEGAISTLQSSVATAQTDIDAAEVSISALQSSMTTAQTDIDAAEAAIVVLQNAGGGGGGNLGASATVTNSSGTASFVLQSTNDAVADDQIQFTIDLDRGGSSDALDYKYQMANDGHALVFTQWQHAGASNQVQRELIRYCAGGQLLLSGGKYAASGSFDGANDDHIRSLGQHRFYHNMVFQTGAAWSQYQPTSATDATLPNGSFKTLDDALYFRTSTGTWKKAILSDYSASAPAAPPTLGVYDSSNKPASWTSLASGSHHLVLGNGSNSQDAQTYRFTLPSSPSDGDCIELTNLALVHFRLPSTGTSTLYFAVANSGSCDISNTKDLRFNASYRGYHRITFTSTPNNTAQKRWIATSGELV